MTIKKDMQTKISDTYTVDIFMAGDITQARQICREFCYEEGFCVHICSVDYIYTGGEETGFKIGCINYPRFPIDAKSLLDKAERLGNLLLERLFQHSFCLVTPDRTVWKTRREGV